LQGFHPFEAHDDRPPSYIESEMSAQHPVTVHEHVAKRVHVLLQRAGVPYEMEQQVCTSCSRVLDEKPVKRAAA
jgi:NMD protein affecting ribosome stability and mRNA decay